MLHTTCGIERFQFLSSLGEKSLKKCNLYMVVFLLLIFLHHRSHSQRKAKKEQTRHAHEGT